MAISFKAPEPAELRPRITVLGVGGAGGNAVNNMISSNLEGVDFIVANTDAQALAQSKAETRIQLGVKATEGLGAGAQPAVGRAGAEEALEEILEHLQGTHMVFITAGMGGGTGTGAAPVIAKAVREAGILTVGVVTKPFAFEGQRRMRIAEQGISELQQYVHTQIVIPNQNLFRLATEETTFAQAFAMADDVLSSGVRGVTDLIVMPGMINLDFADIKSVIAEMGKAMMGTGEAEGEDRAKRAAELAISNPLLDDVSVKGAKGVLINITGGKDLTLVEVDQAAEVVKGLVDPDANIIFGNTILDDMEGKIRVSIVATGIDAESMRLSTPQVAAKNVERIRPATPRPRATAAAASASDEETSSEDAPNSVRNQYKFLADQLRSAVGETSRADAPELAQSPAQRPAVRPIGATVRPPLGETPLPVRESMKAEEPPMRVAPAPEAPAPEVRTSPYAAEPAQPVRTWTETKPKRHGWFLGSRRHEKAEEPARLEPSRLEPAPMRPSLSTPPADAATVQPIRPMPEYATVSSPVRPTGKPQTEDLFQGQPQEDAFEIPSFLRKQANN